MQQGGRILAEDTIVSIRFDEVIVPAHPGVINSSGLDKPLHMLPVKGKPDWSTQFDALSKVVMRLQLKGGVIGLGEFYRGHSWDILEDVAGKLLGQNIGDLSRQALPVALCREYDGFECAIWDATAKLLGIPLHQLLGGAVRKTVKVGAWSSHRTVDEIGPWARQYADQGYDCIKLKTDLEDDCIGWSEQIASHNPGMKIILDPNQRWENLGEAKRITARLEKVGNVLLLEDPIPRWMLQDYERLRSMTAIPVFLHVSLPYVYQGQRVHEAVNALMHGAVDGFNFNAGLAKFQQLNHIAHAANLSCWHGSEIDLGILEAMYVHQAAAAMSCTLPSDIFGRMIRQHDLLTEPLRFNPPFVDVPKGPGLGIELDDAAIDTFAIDNRIIAD
jgi:muconate cycloisomerase